MNADSIIDGNLFYYCSDDPVNRIDPYGNSDYNDDSVFHDSVTPGMRKFLRRSTDYYYKVGNRAHAWMPKKGKTPGWIDCVYLLSEQFRGPSSSDIRYNQDGYFDEKGEIGDLVARIRSGEAIENFVYVEVFQWDGKTLNKDGTKHMHHCGTLVIHDFGDELGNQLAVFQSASDPIDFCSVLFSNDTGPNLSALFDYNGGTGHWTHYGIRHDKRHTYVPNE